MQGLPSTDWPRLLYLTGCPALSGYSRLRRQRGAMAAVTDVQRLQARVEELERWGYTDQAGSRGSRKVSDLGSSGPLGQRGVAYWPGPGDGCCSSSPVARN